MTNSKRNIKDLAKASMCASLAGMTAVSGAASTAFAIETIGNDGSLPVVQESEKSVPTTPEQVRDALDSANVKVTQAETAKSAAEKALSDAKGEHVSSQAVHGYAVSAYDKADAEASDAFDAAVRDAASAVDSTSAANASAKAAYESAVADKAAANKAVEDAKAAVEAAERAYDEALGSAPDAKAASDELESAKSALAEAQRLSEEAAAAVSEAKGNLDSAVASLGSSERELAVAEKANEDAKAALASARSAYEAAVVARNAADPAELSEAQSALDDADAALSSAESKATAAADALAAAKADHAAAEEKANAATSSYDEALAVLEAIDVESAKADLVTAKQAYDAAEKAAADAAGDASAANSLLASREAEKNDAAKAYEDAISAAASAQTALDDAIAKLEEAKALTENASESVISLYDFFVDSGDDNVLAEFDRKSGGASLTEINEATRSGVSGDATDYRNVLLALQTIRELNEVRVSLGLSELLVCDDLMARGTVSANWSSSHIAHSTGCGNENLAWGMSKPVVGWYDSEKKIWDKAVETGEFQGTALPAGWQSMTAAQLSAKAPDFYSAVGHYLNVIKPSWKFVGAAVNTVPGTYGGIVAEQNYRGYANGWYGTVDEWEARFMEWVNAKLAGDGDPAAIAQSNVDAAKAALEAADAMVTDAKASLDAASARYEAARSDADDKSVASAKSNEGFEKASADLEAAKSALSVAEASKSSAQLALEKSKSAMDTANSEKAYAEEILSAASSAKLAADDEASTALLSQQSAAAHLSEISSKHARLDSDLDDASTKLSASEAAAVTASDNLEGAKEGHGAALTDFDGASSALEDATKNKDDADALLIAATDRHSAAASVYDEAIAAAGELASSADALTASKAALVEAEKSVSKAADLVTACSAELESAEAAHAAALSKLARAEALSYAAAFDAPIADSDFAYLNDKVDSVKAARALVESTAADMEVAKSKMEAAKAAYDEACSAWSEAIADASFYKNWYESLTAKEEVAGGSEIPSDAPYGSFPQVSMPSYAAFDASWASPAAVAPSIDASVDGSDGIAVDAAEETVIADEQTPLSEGNVAPVKSSTVELDRTGSNDDSDVVGIAGAGLVASIGIAAAVAAMRSRRRD